MFTSRACADRQTDDLSIEDQIGSLADSAARRFVPTSKIGWSALDQAPSLPGHAFRRSGLRDSPAVGDASS